jgi:hypothetical protein
MAADIRTAISTLIDGWCERRALRPLAIILPVWPPPNNFSEDWQYVWAAMKHLRAICRDDLAAHDENGSVNQVIAELSRCLFPDEKPQEIEQAAEQILRTIFGGERT